MKYVALLRGINVGGNRSVRMNDLKQICESLNFSHVTTYLQSGNVVFEARTGPSEILADKLEKALFQRYRFEVKVHVKTAGEWSDVVSKNPLQREKNIDKSKLHATFLLNHPPGIDDQARRVDDRELQMMKAKEEMIARKGEVIYLYCPKGYGRSKLNNPSLERKLKAVATTRNWKTVCALLELVKA